MSRKSTAGLLRSRRASPPSAPRFLGPAGPGFLRGGGPSGSPPRPPAPLGFPRGVGSRPGGIGRVCYDLLSWSQLFNVYGESCTCDSEPSLPCPSTCRSGRSCSTFTALHVHMLRNHGRFANRLAQVVTAVPRLRRVMYTLFGAVVALPIDVFKCSYSFNTHGDVIPIRFGATDARSIYLLKCS